MAKFNSDWIERNLYYREIPDTDGVLHFEQYERPVIVCLCGSTRFYEEFQKANYEETMAGKIVLSVGHYPHTIMQRVTIDGCMGPEEVMVPVQTHGESVGCTQEQKIALDVLHKEKIALADEVLILNVDGYVGSSTEGELLYAIRLGKTIRWRFPDKIPDRFKPPVEAKP